MAMNSFRKFATLRMPEIAKPETGLMPRPPWAPRFRFGFFDALLIAAVLGASAWTWPLLMAGPGQEAVVMIDGKAEARLQLSGGTRQMKVTGRLGPMLLEYGESGVRVVAAPCPNQICVHQSWVKRAGARITCLPSHMVIALSGQSSQGRAPDGITY